MNQPHDPAYSAAWSDGLAAADPVMPAQGAKKKPVDQDAADYLSAWNDDKSGPLESAVRAAGVAPVAAQSEDPRKAKA